MRTWPTHYSFTFICFFFVVGWLLFSPESTNRAINWLRFGVTTTTNDFIHWIILLLLSVLAATGLLSLCSRITFIEVVTDAGVFTVWSVDQTRHSRCDNCHRLASSNFGRWFGYFLFCFYSVDRMTKNITAIWCQRRQKKMSVLGEGLRFDKRACAGIIRQMWMLYA